MRTNLPRAFELGRPLSTVFIQQGPGGLARTPPGKNGQLNLDAALSVRRHPLDQLAVPRPVDHMQPRIEANITTE
jgi:hypothetical protein